MIEISQFGAGRIGRIHAGNIAANDKARLRFLVDVDQAAAKDLAARAGAEVCDADTALTHPKVDAVVIASSTDTHAGLIEAAARAGKAVFCEKPIDLDLTRAGRCVDAVTAAGVAFQVGFNRRFDPSFAALHEAIRGGRIGALEMLAITSRDPEPPPPDYVKVSGGLFRDMMIHDFDMARWLLGAEPIELFAMAGCLVDPAIGALGDVDTAVVTLRADTGALCQIANSRRAVYGYDQRIEAFGAAGMVQAGNRAPTTLEASTADGVSRDKPLHFFLERYAESYAAELDHFLDCVQSGRPPALGGNDGLRALMLAEAANESLKTNRPVAL